MAKRKSRAEIYKIRYQIYRDLGYSAKEARRLRSHALDVSEVKIKRSGEVNKNVDYNNIKRSVSIDNFNKEVQNDIIKGGANDTVLSDWGYLHHKTSPPAIRNKSAKTIKYIQKTLNVNNDQAYYFLYYMVTNNKTFAETKHELLSSREFEMYSRKKVYR